MISFASVNAVLFSPALPNIASYFAITTNRAQETIIWFLVGYAFGQLIYGPLANRFGRKPTLYLGISLQILSSFLCILAGIIHYYPMLVLGRFLVALGSGVGLQMTFTLVNECYETQIASQKTAYLVLAFAITPALGVALGGILNAHFGWMSCFLAGAIYGLILLVLVRRLPETQSTLNLNALKIKHLFHNYISQFKNIQLIAGGFLMGSSTSFVYVFAALAPFIAMNLLGMNSAEYGIANIVPAIGLVSGSLCAAQLAKQFALKIIIRAGLSIIASGILLMIITVLLQFSALFSLFLPMVVIYFGLSFIVANAPTLAMSQIHDKAHGSAVMNFINMGLATIAVISIGHFHVTEMMLPVIFMILCIAMIGIYKLALSQEPGKSSI